MFTKHQKRLLSRCCRDFVKHGRERELGSLRYFPHRVYDSDGCSWIDFFIIPLNPDVDRQMRFLYDYFGDLVAASLASLPDYDCSGKAFMGGFTLSEMPCGIAVKQYWYLDV